MSRKSRPAHVAALLILALFSLVPVSLNAQVLTLAPGAGRQDCGSVVRCKVASGEYLVRPPRGWNGRSPLPTLMFFHGYQESAESVMEDRFFRDFADKNGILLVAPHGEGRTWSYPGSPGHYRDEFAFVRAVLDDVTKRYPIETKRLWASGFSQGGSMVWYLACEMGDRFRAFAPVSGAFWLPQPTSCKGGPVDLRHVHGTNDDTVPMTGRAIGLRYRQGDVLEGFRTLRALDGCPATPDTVAMEDGLRCESWISCSSGKQLKLCLHPGGHAMEASYLEASWAWVKSLKD
ncbi:MAG: polyhydroxybutyrate depolymerase [Beijerinckiaceae bacterium]|nr:polyhydroxybutyrate depolymerase [Beijerinckiaceae bacterium]